MLSVKPHPKADRLKVVDVDWGTDMSVVVTNAANVEEGMKVVFAVSSSCSRGEEGRRRLEPACAWGSQSPGGIVGGVGGSKGVWQGQGLASQRRRRGGRDGVDGGCG